MMRVVVFALVVGITLPAAAERPTGTLECKATGTDFAYACVIRLTQGGKPLQGVKVTLGADMPSMPMVHNVKPVTATATGEPGVYLATLDLEMHGLWAVKVRLAGAVRDQLILRYEFDDKGATAAKPGARGTMPHGSESTQGSAMPHGGGTPHGAPMQEKK